MHEVERDQKSLPQEDTPLSPQGKIEEALGARLGGREQAVEALAALGGLVLKRGLLGEFAEEFADLEDDHPVKVFIGVVGDVRASATNSIERLQSLNPDRPGEEELGAAMDTLQLELKEQSTTAGEAGESLEALGRLNLGYQHGEKLVRIIRAAIAQEEEGFGELHAASCGLLCRHINSIVTINLKEVDEPLGISMGAISLQLVKRCMKPGEGADAIEMAKAIPLKELQMAALFVANMSLRASPGNQDANQLVGLLTTDQGTNYISGCDSEVKTKAKGILAEHGLRAGI